MVEAAKRNGVELMVAQCLRFWPEYVYLKETVDSGRMGKLVKAEFVRRAAKPVWTWDGWMTDAVRSGGAMLDLHVHDVDYVNYLLGKPSRLYARALKTPATGGYDLVSALYTYEGGPEVLVDASWYQATTFDFRASYLAVFEEGLLHFDSTRKPTLHEHRVGQEVKEVSLEGDAYYRELEFFVNCLIEGRSPATVVAPESARQSLELIEAERRSAEAGQPVTP
jgi:predicted dehydrogenase